MIKLGIDAKWYFEGPPSGHMVVKNLVDEIIKINNKFEIYLFVNKQHVTQAEELFKKEVKIIGISAIPNLLANMFLIPHYSRKYKLDSVIFQNFNGLWPSNITRICYLYDVLFLDFPEYFTMLELVYFKFMTFLARRANRIITISQSEKDRIIKHHIGTPENIMVNHLGVNENFKPLEAYDQVDIDKLNAKYNLPNSYLLYVGRLNVRKNILNLVKSLPLLENKTIKLIIVGKPESADHELSNFISVNHLDERILFTGFVPESDLYFLYARSTLFCFPSFAEGFGLPPLEAIQCGIPVIVSSTTSLPEVCGEAGTYVDPRSPLDIAEKINKLLADDELYSQKKQEGLRHIKRFSWSISAAQILNSFTDKEND
jgi:glycosyltransferase involved in cell wall biosynthesis